MEYKDVFHENDFISRQITEEIEKLEFGNILYSEDLY